MKIEKLEQMIAIQQEDGNWNDSEYMRGLLNGMIISHWTMADNADKYDLKDKPTMYNVDIRFLDKFNNSGVVIEP